MVAEAGASIQAEDVNNDPFRVDQLILDYDYMLYRIKDHVASIHLATTELCRKQNQLVCTGIVEEIIDSNIKNVRELLTKCKELETYFEQLHAIDGIVSTFHERMDEIVKQYRDIKVHTDSASRDHVATK
ncbi:AER242Cp [Eremothecium gossypii ATCC 10895]|uniref:Biogenesis of lysosome-related organelles complex 1 subunit CNL1 n=1 Tax=Eremothecium gossypii (strain ATCC 10895 / CBS 109.51 / FGSC 9923 / NRRL Y-1056) TaxID=284811 RepID=BL1S4_EREGS|nr:AER242Cp [Eremothecium gossypii ATCC 10895]Q756L2.1 RecName: Full=Biogenesis of lysosome-related organelles complex 1 subunit CNL1; Short=BLOC-1 subunit CNL1; AltName: Full=CNO-like protein 1 [Eremothecium gossypii ATCC 10895]AAS52923.1 AER242Cp [Eremothecium gossypii ATCC 10895]AEY97231.1 FAER242Cp [Eremothecium gossypii FDAG1]